MKPVLDRGVANLVARLLPNSRVVGALQQFTAEHIALGSLGALETDVPVVADDIEAADLTEGLIDEIRGFDSAYPGPLRSSAARPRCCNQRGCPASAAVQSAFG